MDSRSNSTIQKDFIRRNQFINANFSEFSEARCSIMKQQAQEKQILFAARKVAQDLEEQRYKKFLVSKDQIIKEIR